MKGKTLKALIVSLIAAMLIFIPVMAAPQTAEAANNTYHMTEARELAKKVNQFRSKTQWVYNIRNKRVNIASKGKLQYDYGRLEQYAKLRAKEAAEMYVKYGLTHTRPNGKDTPKNIYVNSAGSGGWAENLDCYDLNVAQVQTRFEESNNYYADQGHRRNMLSLDDYLEDTKYKSFAVACYEKKINGKTLYFWAEEFSTLPPEKPDSITQKGSEWVYEKNLTPIYSYTGVTNNENGWWYVRKGKVDFNYNGFAKNNNGTWWIENGKVTFKKNDIIHTKLNGVDGWYNVRDSKLTPGTSSNRVYNNANGWWYIDNNGKVDFSKNSIEPNINGWWYIKNGQVDFNYTGFAKNYNGWWYCEKGKVTFKYNGKVRGTINGKTATYTVKGSKVML